MYTTKDAIKTFYEYLGKSEENFIKIPQTDDRGIIMDLDGEDCIVFLYPIGHKADDTKNYFDTRDSGGPQRIIANKYALNHKLKFFIIGLHNQVEKYKDYFFFLECKEEQIQEIDGTANGRRDGKGTQIVIPNTFTPRKKFERITTKLGIPISVVHKSEIYNYLRIYDNRLVFETVNSSTMQLSTTAKECARQIFDKLFEYDKFEKILPLFILNTNIKIDCSEICSDNALYNVFYTSGSTQFQDPLRIFIDKDYSINLDGTSYVCRLTNQWCGFGNSDGDNASNRNWLWALRDIVNLHYKDIFKIDNDGANAKLISYEQKSTNSIPAVSNDVFIKSLHDQFVQNPTTLRYIRSLLAKPFAILTGNSGTGKTRIALNLAKYLEKNSTDGKYKNSLLIPVGADWTDNTKLLGFYNPMTHRYQSITTLDFILNAQKNLDIPFFLILDEMNLSHVERYFSDFLSAMESGENIPLYKKDVDCKEEVIPESINLPQNLFVTGTVNIDETTYMFSPKVLDRANVIEFKPKDKEVLNLFSDDSKNTEVETAESGVAEAFLKVSETVRNSQLANYSLKSFDKAKDKLESLYEILKKSGFEFAFRTVKEIRYYIIAACELSDNKDEFDVTSFLDEQIVQKILPKIHGNRKQIGTLLNNLEDVCTESSYELSKAKIAQMKNRLEKYQYASFI